MIERYFSYHFLYFLLISSWKKLGQQNMLCKNGGCVTMKIQDESGCYVQQRQVRQIWVCSIKESAKSFVWDGITLCTSTGQTAGKRLYRNWEYWWNTHWIQCSWLREVVLPLSVILVRLYWDVECCVQIQVKRQAGKKWSKSKWMATSVW